MLNKLKFLLFWISLSLFGISIYNYFTSQTFFNFICLIITGILSIVLIIIYPEKEIKGENKDGKN